jgi:hypothetical protein
MSAEQHVAAASPPLRSRGNTTTGASLGWLASLPSTADLLAVVMMLIFVLPPFKLRLLGRGGDVFPLELVLPLALPLLLWHHNLRFVRRPAVTALAFYVLCCLPSFINVTDKPRWIYGMLLFSVALALLWCLTSIRPRVQQLDRLLTWSPLPFVSLATIIIVY